MSKRKSAGQIRSGLQNIMIPTVPSFANRFFYSLGFLSAVSFTVLVITGTLMALFGPHWWITSPLGQYTRSIHLWATQAFVIFIILHVTIVFLTSGFLGVRKWTWVLGVLMFLFALAEAEFGYVLRGDFSSQYRSLQGSDFYNGSGLGHWINNLNTGQIMGIHVVVIPLLLIVLICSHYFLVRVLGVGKPSPMADKYPVVKANHWLLFWRGSAVTAVVASLAVFYPSPYLQPLSINKIATEDPSTVSQTLVKEFDRSSDTATYQDNIDPYTFDSRTVFIESPYNQLISTQTGPNRLSAFNADSANTQKSQLADATKYYADTNSFARPKDNPSVDVIDALTAMAKSGLYEAALRNDNGAGYDSTYVTRFLADTGIPNDTANSLKLTTDQYGMVHEEDNKSLPLGAWWLLPIGWLNHTILAKDNNGDRDAALIIGSFMLLLLAFPFIPFINRIPSRLGLQKLIWLRPPR